MNVRDYGAVGNGTTDDTAAIAAAYAALGAQGGVLDFPPGTYVVGQIVLTQPNVTWRGTGMHSAVLKGSNANGMLLTVGATNPTFEDLGFDGAGVAATAYVNLASTAGLVTFRRCRFTRLGIGIYLLASPCLLDGNLFEGDGGGALGTGVHLSGPLSHGRITNNRFRYCSNGVLVDTGSQASNSGDEKIVADIEYSGNATDLGFYTLRERETGGAGAVYTATTLTDTTKTFSGFGGTDYLRVMPTKAAGTATLGGTELTDAAANFLTAQVFPGDIVRAGGRFAIVAAVWSATTLSVEEWLSETDRTVVASPANGSYTVYGVLLGKYISHTPTQITVYVWTTLNGTPVTSIPPGTRYELLFQQPNYPLHAEPGSRNWRIVNNTFLRGYSDQISYYGTHGMISNNYVAWGQDMGLTVWGANNTISGNRVHHQGVSGIAGQDMTDSIIVGNSVTDTTWANHIAVGHAAGIMIIGHRNVISSNVVSVNTPMPQARHGIAILGLADQNVLLGNATRGHGVAGLRFDNYGGPTTTTRVLSHLSTNEPAERSYAAGSGSQEGRTTVLTDNVAVPILSVTVATNSMHASLYRYSVEVTNGTDFQVETGIVEVRAINKAGTVSRNVCTKNFGQVDSAHQGLSAGTLSVTFTISAANPAVIAVNANSSLTPSAGYPLLTFEPLNLTRQAFAWH